MKTQPSFRVPQILAMRQWFHKKEIENLGSHLDLSAAEVRAAIEDPEYMETIANLMRTTRSRAQLKRWIETYPCREMPIALAKKFGVLEADMAKLIAEVEDWLTSRT